MIEHETKGDPRDPQREGWLSRLENDLATDPDYMAETLALGLIEEAIALMEERGISRSDLSSTMHVSRPYVTHILNAPPNLTLRSIAMLALALGTRPHVSLHPTCPADGQRRPSSSRPAQAERVDAVLR
jgi:hypothetical protein